MDTLAMCKSSLGLSLHLPHAATRGSLTLFHEHPDACAGKV